MKRPDHKFTRRDMLRLSLLAGGATLIGSRGAWGQTCPVEPPQPHPIEPGYGIGVGGEPMPTSPFILNPFTDPLPAPPGSGPAGWAAAPLTAMKPGWRHPDGTLAAPNSPDAWKCRMGYGTYYTEPQVVYPGPNPGHQDAYGNRPVYNSSYGCPNAGTHQLWPGTGVVANYPNPIYYHIRLQVRQHAFTTSPVLPIGTTSGPTATSTGQGFPVTPPFNVVSVNGNYYLPPSTIYGFNGTFPGPMINAEYGKPVCVRFENDLDMNPNGYDRADFGAPDWAFLTHLHNGHTAPESDGQPHHMQVEDGGYIPATWCDNLYLLYPAGGDDNEKQSFLWFHDHRMHHTGANVYKGMVGLMPHYDPLLDPGDETLMGKKGALGLPGRRVNNADGTFEVKYDIPLALYDVTLDDGVTQHQDWHNGCGQTHPEWWGNTFFRHYPNHGFVGDIFTINGVAYPVLHVYRRKYRLRFLGASIARIYDLWLMRGTPAPAPGTQGQWQLPNGAQCMRFNQIASEGGLLPKSITRDHFEIWPAKRREFVVDFTRYMDGSPTCALGVPEEIYLVNTLQMQNGRKPKFKWDTLPPDPGEPVIAFDPNYRVPMMKIVIHPDPLPEPDVSVVPNILRPMPAIPANWKTLLPGRTFTLQRGGTAGGETEWLINGLQFDPQTAMANPVQGIPELWTVVNGGGGWVHPMHMHMEEHQVLERSSKLGDPKRHADDTGKEDVVALDPSESVTFYRNFRTFKGNYVAHCHNLAHEDHNMMFGWTIV